MLAPLVLIICGTDNPCFSINLIWRIAQGKKHGWRCGSLSST